MADDRKLKNSTISLLVSQAPIQPKEAPIIKEPQYRFRACIDDICISNYRTISLRSAESIITVKVGSPISMRLEIQALNIYLENATVEIFSRRRRTLFFQTISCSY